MIRATPVQNIPPELLSNLIGSIYDCVAEPTRWPDTIRYVCEELRCMLGSIMLFDFNYSRHRNIAGWNDEYFTMNSVGKYSEQITAIYKTSTAPFSITLDEPMLASRDCPAIYSEELPYYRDLAKPLGICDSIQTIVLRDIENRRLGVFAANRHESVGFAGPYEIEVLRLLAPHIRRAVTIGDLLNLGAALNETLASSLNMLRVGVILAAGDGRILHANQAAERMFKKGRPVRSRNGFLVVNTREAQDELLRALRVAQQDEATIGACGIGVPIPDDEGFPAIAHVLPLKGSVIRARLAPRAAAAVFVAQGEEPQKVNLDAISRLFGLTRGEQRLLAEIADGAGVTEAASRLGISEATARTHVQHIFRKTGVSRQADLIQLIATLVPGARLPDKE